MVPRYNKHYRINMLKPEHIRVLKLDRDRLEGHSKLPPPSYSIKPLTNQLAAISDTTVSTLLHLDMEAFRAQLPKARTYGVSYLTKTADGKVIGVSAATSLIKQGMVIRKHLVLPTVELNTSNKLDTHIIIGVFVRSIIVNDYLPVISRVELAGWVDASMINEIKSENVPQGFQSKLPVVMIPCSKLNPIATLEQHFKQCVEGGVESDQPQG